MMKRMIGLIAVLLALLVITGRAQTGLSTTACPGAGCSNVSVEGAGTMGVQVAGTFSGTLVFEYTNDDSTWYALSLYVPGSSTAVTSTTATGFWSGPVAGMKRARVRFSVYTSGTATVYTQTASANNTAVAAAGGSITGGTCTNQAVTALNTSGVPTCTTLTGSYTDTSIAKTGTDVNTANQVTATHLAAPLPVAQGGTSLATLTAHAVYVGNGTSAPTALAVCGTGTYIRGAVGADPVCSTLTLPNAATQGDLLTATGANAVGSVADVATGQVLTSGGVGAVPAYSASPTLTAVNFGSAVLTNADGANIVAQRNGTTAQLFKVYNTFTDASNYERARFAWVSNILRVGMENAGTGVARSISIEPGATHSWLFASGGGVTTNNDNQQDIGASGATRPRTGYFGTSVVAPLVNATTGVQINGAATSGQYLIGNGTNFVGILPAWMTANPANQTGNATATLKMNGLGAAAAPCVITPVATGRVRFAIYGTIANTLTADGVTYKLAYNSGSIPANGAALTGNILGVQQTWTALTGELNTLFHIEGVATGMTLSTVYWFDLQLADVTGGTASATNVVCVATEG